MRKSRLKMRRIRLKNEKGACPKKGKADEAGREAEPV